MKKLHKHSCHGLAAGLLCCLTLMGYRLVAQQRQSLATPATPAQIREYLELTKTDELYRANWMNALEMNRSKGAPYWPESFWSDLKEEMLKTDLRPVIIKVYQKYVPAETMKVVNASLHKQSVSEFAATSFGANFCKLQKSMDRDSQAATLDLTQATFERVYTRDKASIDAARAKYSAEHPNWVERQ